jgi:hypothetical protein
MKANAFASTFYFFPTHKLTLKNKKSLQANAPEHSKIDTIDLRPKRTTTGNIGLPQWGLTWLIEVQCFYQSLCLFESEVLLKPPLRQAVKRYRQANGDISSNHNTKNS